MAELLFMSQSQYQRRERGEIRISDEEWLRMAKFLGREVEDIKEAGIYRNAETGNKMLERGNRLLKGKFCIAGL